MFFPLRLAFLQSLLDPESQKHDWLELALTHDAPQPSDTMTPEGNPRSGFSLCTNLKGSCGCAHGVPVVLVAGGILTASAGATDASCPSWSVSLQTCPPNRRWRKAVAAAATGWATSTCAASCSSARKPSPPSAIWMTSVCWRILRVKARSSPSTSKKTKQ